MKTEQGRGDRRGYKSLALVVAYTEEANLGLLQPGAGGRFYPECSDLPVFQIRIIAIDRTNTHHLTLKELALNYGGGVAVRNNSVHQLTPEPMCLPYYCSKPRIPQLRFPSHCVADLR